MSRALARRPRQHTTVARIRESLLANMLADVAEDDLDVVRAAGRAREIDSIEAGKSMLALGKEALADIGWTRDELRIAIDAKNPSKLAPFYLRMTHERTLMRYRGQEGERPATEAEVIVVPSTPTSVVEAVPALPPGEDDESSR